MPGFYLQLGGAGTVQGRVFWEPRCLGSTLRHWKGRGFDSAGWEAQMPGSHPQVLGGQCVRVGVLEARTPRFSLHPRMGVGFSGHDWEPGCLGAIPKFWEGRG